MPKTLLELSPEHTIAVIETGANHPGEIKALAEIVDPDFGLITNVGMAHLEDSDLSRGLFVRKENFMTICVPNMVRFSLTMIVKT